MIGGAVAGFLLAPGSFPLMGAVGAAALGKRGPEPTFFGRFMSSPRTIGAIAPSSTGLCRQMADDASLQGAEVVVEWGSGTGVVTRELAARHGGPLVVLEIDPDLAGMTYETVSHLPDARVYAASAAHTRHILDNLGVGACDRLVSGLPWASFPRSQQDELFDVIEDVLAPGGVFVTFAYVHSLGTHGGRRLLAKLLTRFDDVTASPVVWKNLPPGFVYRATRPSVTGVPSRPLGPSFFLATHA
jgi:phosphatidylethanolamine/phosphatidyl-N-methylethanolamine N-methyltransferase